MKLKKLNEKSYSIPTRLIYGKSLSAEWDYSHHIIPPLSASNAFRMESAERGALGFAAIGHGDLVKAPVYVYTRMGEPNNNMLEEALAIAEEADTAVTFATGMAAVHAAACFALNKGSEIISHNVVYGCTYSLFTQQLSRFNIPVHFCDCTKPDSFLEHVNKNTRILYLESPANPTLDLIDLEAIVARVQEINAKREPQFRILTVIDNTFSTPFGQRPLKFGVDVVLHSLTKGINGFGTDMGGVVMTRHEFRDRLIIFRKDFGSTLSPQAAWHIFVYGLSTLNLRIPQQQANALAIAQFLEQHPAVEKVRYPGLPSFPQYEVAQRLLRDYEGKFAPGFIVYFTLKAASAEESRKRGEQMMDYIAQNAYTITLAVSLGQLRTLIEHPGSMTHCSYSAEEQLKRGMDPGGIRLAVGIEAAQDIMHDLDNALRHLH